MLSRKSKRKNESANSERPDVSGAGAATPEKQSPRRSSLGRHAGLGTVMLAAVLAAWTGWHFLHHSGHLQVSDKGDQPAGQPARGDAVRNVLLVSIDTCRADRLSCYGYKRRTTPNIDVVARDGALFKMALTPVPITTPAHSSMLTGTYPPAHGVHLNTYDRLADSNITLAKTLREAGYQTAAFVAAFPLDSRFGLNRGFETYDGRFDEEHKGATSRREGEEVNRPAMAWLEDHAQKPFFLFLHYYDAHLPNKPHPPYTSAYSDDFYAGEIAYIDNCIGQILDRLRALGVYDNTLVIITGDHGEGLGEHGELTHCYFIYQSTLHVPLIIRAPGCRKGIQVDGNVSLVDIVPTVLDLVGLKTTAEVQGVDLRPALEGWPAADGKRAVYTESLAAGTFGCSSLHDIVEGRWKYILAPRPELYDLSQDPGELTNLADKEPQVTQRLRGRLETMFKELERAASPRRPSTVDPADIKRLESLGYVSASSTPADSALDATREDPKDFLPTYLRCVHALAQFVDGCSNQNEKVKKELLEIVASSPELIMPHRLLALIALDEGRPADAVAHSAKIVAMLEELKDPLKRPLGARQELALAHCILGLALQAMGKSSEAASHYEQALRIAPDQADVHLNLGNVLDQAGKVSEAIAHYEQALRIKPDEAAIHYNLALALGLEGNAAEAATHYAAALRLQADLLGALNNLAWIRAISEDARLRDGPEAVRLAQRACQLAGQRETNALRTLAAAYAEAGRFAEAVQTARQALELARQQNKLSLAESMRAGIRLYEARKPFRESPSSPSKTSIQP